MSCNYYLKKIKDWFIAQKEIIQEWAKDFKKKKRSNSPGAARSRHADSGWIWRSWLWRIRFVWRMLLLLLFVAILVVLVTRLKNCSGWGNWEDTVERETSFVVVEIKKISEFTTVTYYEEQLIEKTKEESHVLGLFSTNEQLAVVVKGTIKVGFDFSTMTESDVSFGEDGVLRVKLPKPKILDTIINPNDVDIVYGGNNHVFTDDDYKDVINQAEKQLVDHAIAEGIFEKASNQGIIEMTNLLNALGFDEVDVSI